MLSQLSRMVQDLEDAGRVASAGMKSFWVGVQAKVANDRGASAIEYALLAAMVALALVAFVTPINTAITNMFTAIQNALAPPAGS